MADFLMYSCVFKKSLSNSPFKNLKSKEQKKFKVEVYPACLVKPSSVSLGETPGPLNILQFNWASFVSLRRIYSYVRV
ncbi:MAG: hypothetical protein D5R98_06050 [Desulfonatronovibrio sp. MSAO_Bac4]|nr:MAG: hypothetical protein D5R98_06050 [Desulfonatronovibrio sp. MSAO_Bac4]